MNRGRGGSRRPNRGGGRHNVKPRTSTRAVLSSAVEEREDLEDDNDDDEEFNLEAYAEANKIRDPSPVKESAVTAKTKRRFKAPIQKLQMNVENQKMIEEVLQDLQLTRSSSQDYKSLYFSAKQAKFNEAYWKKVGDQKLVIESGVNYAADRDGELEIDDEIYSSYAVKKLLKCGFEKMRCVEALKQNDSDLGAALQSLLCSCCGLSCLGRENPDYSDERFQEASVQRQEEAMALESIYNEAFSEVIADTVWTINFSLPFLLDKFKPNSSGKNTRKSKANKKVETSANICRFFLQGYCKFGDRCRLKHIASDEGTSSNKTTNNSDDKRDTISETANPCFPFHLEIRFCKGSLYPFEPPMVVFYSTHESVPSSGCLNVTLRLNKEAKDLCDAESPVVFCLASLLENEDEILECFKMPPSEYSLPANKSVSTHSVRGPPTSEKTEVANKKSERTQPQTSSDEPNTHQKNRKLKEQFQRLQVILK